LWEFLGANPRYEVNVVTEIEKLDEEGFIHNPRSHGIAGLARAEYTFTRVDGGTLYENRLLIGAAQASAGWRRAISPLLRRLVMVTDLRGFTRPAEQLRHCGRVSVV